ARSLGRSKALISKSIGDLEQRLGARLLNRTTRQIGLTEIGSAYLQRARELVAEFDALEDAVRSNSTTPRGRLRLTAPQAFGELELMGLICGFRAKNPDVEPDIFLSDRVVDLVGEGFDVALRVTSMPDSTLIARKLCDVPMRICAAPSYLARAGTPVSPADLADHACIVDTNLSTRDVWRFKSNTRNGFDSVKVGSVLAINSALAVRQAALSGVGIAACPDFTVARDLASGALLELFPEATDYDLALHIVYPHRLHLSAKARAFIDFTTQWYTKGKLNG
ncbi:MAG: LysR family transcriptional regulator, partial [Hyphomicrobiaceae bacterium]